MKLFISFLFAWSSILIHAQSDLHVSIFFVVVDTSYRYAQLDSLMYELSDKAHIEIGDLHHFETKTARLCDYDFEYAEANEGDSCFYYVRRFPMPYLSIEYWNALQNVYDSEFDGDDGQFALVAGNYQSKEEAILRKKELRSVTTDVFILETESYMGCTR